MEIPQKAESNGKFQVFIHYYLILISAPYKQQNVAKNHWGLQLKLLKITLPHQTFEYSCFKDQLNTNFFK